MLQETRKKADCRWIFTVLLAALAVRLVLAAVTEGYPYDRSCFVAWGEKIARYGTAEFYAPDYFADYPPGYLLVLGLIGKIRLVWHIPMDAKRTSLLLALVPALCDCGIAALVYCAAGKRRDEPAARRLTLFTAFCPVLLFDTAIWRQIDGAFTLPMLGCFFSLHRKKYLLAALCYGVALAIKPQALLLGPVLAVCFLAAVLHAKSREGCRRAALRIPAGVLTALAPVLICGLPFFGVSALIPGLLEKYFSTSTSYPYATINAFNWFAALGGNWAAQTERVLGPISWQGLGMFHLLLLTVALALLAALSCLHKRFSPVLLAGFYSVGVFTLSHRMHERYLIPGALLVLLAAALHRDRRLLGIGAGLSLTSMLNLAAVYSLAGSNDEWLTSATSRLFGQIVGLSETVLFVLLALVTVKLCLGGNVCPLLDANDKAESENAADFESVPSAMPRWTRREVAALLVLTAFTAVLSFANLGELTAPQSALDTNSAAPQNVTITLPEAPAELWAYPGISSDGKGQLLVESADGTHRTELELKYTTTFTWQRCDMSGAAAGEYTVTLSDGMMMELSFRNAEGKPIPVASNSPLFDEQALVPRAISQLNSMYFDEIYHGRTGYEMLHAMRIYETTHPPLGKVFLMLGIALFGMTGFGWRFSGTLFGVLLVPLMWWFARRLTRKPWVGAAAAALLALDWMRFAQSRIATIDIYGAFFILLGATCMVWYCQTVLERGVLHAFLPMALGGAAFGLGCASKWTGIYAGAGLAVLYFGALYARWRQKQPGFRREFAAAIAGGVLCYVLLPLAIYIGAYFPYLWRNPQFGLQDWWACQTYMYGYHSGLEATHPFESRWYTWPLLLRPVWYYSNGNLPSGTAGSIAGIGGPVVWLGGLAAVLAVGARLLLGYGSRRERNGSAGVLILYAAQLAPWVLVTRCTFAYHYLPSSLFGLGAIVLLLGFAKNEARAKRAAAVLCVVSLALLVRFYPILSGLPVSAEWAVSLRALPSWGFYSI